MIIEALVDGGGEQANIWVRAGHGRDALGCGEEADQSDAARAAILEPPDGCYCRVARRQHGIDEHGQPLAEVLRDLAVVFDGGEGVGVAVETDVTDTRRRYEVEQPVEQSVAGPQ